MDMQDRFDRLCVRSACQARRILDEPCENVFHLVRDKVVVEQNGQDDLLLLYPEPRSGGRTVRELSVPPDLVRDLRKAWIMYNLDLIVEYNLLAKESPKTVAEFVSRNVSDSC